MFFTCGSLTHLVSFFFLFIFLSLSSFTGICRVITYPWPYQMHLVAAVVVEVAVVAVDTMQQQ